MLKSENSETPLSCCQFHRDPVTPRAPLPPEPAVRRPAALRHRRVSHARPPRGCRPPVIGKRLVPRATLGLLRALEHFITQHPTTKSHLLTGPLISSGESSREEAARPSKTLLSAPRFTLPWATRTVAACLPATGSLHARLRSCLADAQVCYPQFAGYLFR